MELQELLEYAATNRASDLHISSGMPPIVRINGELKPLASPVLDDEQVRAMLQPYIVNQSLFEQHQSFDFSITLKNFARFRVNIFKQSRGLAAVFRIIPFQVPSLAEINAPAVFKKIATTYNGLVLVTGPTGVGKSTTLAAIVNYLNENLNSHILTIEDPIEFVHESKQCLVNQREIGRDTPNFEDALKFALREDPDIILVGELRDLETIRLALNAAETGHLVFATLHTSSAAKSIDRIVEIFLGDEKFMIRTMLADSLKAVISQKLLTKKSGGRIAAYEIMINTSGISNLIREGKINQIYSALQTGSDLGMQTMEQGLEELKNQNLIE